MLLSETDLRPQAENALQALVRLETADNEQRVCEQGTNRAAANGQDWTRPSDPMLKPKDLIGIPWRVAFALQADGWYLRQDIIWSKPNPMPESVTDRCTKAHEYVFLLSKSERYYWDADAIREPFQTDPSERYLERSRITGRGDQAATLAALGQPQQGKSGGFPPTKNGRNKRSVWTINTRPYPGAHFAVFPPDLAETCIKAGSAKGDTVLDPFMGAGTVGLVAQNLERKWIGIELSEEYCGLIKERIPKGHRVSLPLETPCT